MKTVLDYLRRLWARYNPFDISWYIHDMSEPLHEFRKALEEIRHGNNVTIALLENELAEKEFILQQFADVIPDMVWLKEYDDEGSGGKYVYANRAIRDQLLLCPNPIGSTDVELALRAKEIYGVHNHTFGEKCSNSDLATIENDKLGNKSSRFLESGLVKGKMMYLEVHKSVVRTDKGKVIGVCGSGRIITDYIEAVKELETLEQDDIKCCLSVKKLVDVFKKYEFEEE
jgi:hypothetical protein